MVANWDCRLSRRIPLSNGKELASLRDAANLIVERFDSLTASAIVSVATEDLREAAETSRDADIEKATFHVERMVRFYRL